MILATAAALVLAAPPVTAHDFWIVPGTFRPGVGTTVAVSLRVGERFRGEPVLFDRTLGERFFAVAPTGETPVATRQGSEPAGFVRIRGRDCGSSATAAGPPASRSRNAEHWFAG